MKKFIFIIVMLMVGSFAFSQSYHKLIRTNTYWDEFYINYPEFCYTGANRVVFTNQDTVINGHTYRISVQYPFMQVNPGPLCPPFVISTTGYYTLQFLREDTISKKVFIFTPDMNGGTDKLIYDFSLVPGDTLKSYFADNGTLVLDSIGTFLLNNGDSRKIFWFNSNFPEAYYIESIGCSQGLFYPLPIGFTESGGGYFCVKENSVNLLGDNCVYNFVGQNEKDGQTISVFPNPVHDLLKIFLPQGISDCSLSVTNINGKKILYQDLKSGSNTIVVSGILPGFYLYEVKADHIIQNGKLTFF